MPNTSAGESEELRRQNTSNGPSVGEAKEKSLLAPVMRQVLAPSQEPRRRQLDWLTALKQHAHDVRSQIGQSNNVEQCLAIGDPLDGEVMEVGDPVHN